MHGLLLDTHILIWMVAKAPLLSTAWTGIAAAQNSNSLYVTPMTAWEAGVADLKPRAKRPNLLGLPANEWFLRALTETDTAVLPITPEIAMEVCLIPAIYGSGDPGDCFLIATARVHGLTLVTRDERIVALSKRLPGYLSVLPA